MTDLERHGGARWIASRDVRAGALYTDAIVRAINDAQGSGARAVCEFRGLRARRQGSRASFLKAPPWPRSSLRFASRSEMHQKSFLLWLPGTLAGSATTAADVRSCADFPRSSDRRGRPQSQS